MAASKHLSAILNSQELECLNTWCVTDIGFGRLAEHKIYYEKANMALTFFCNDMRCTALEPFFLILLNCKNGSGH